MKPKRIVITIEETEQNGLSDAVKAIRNIANYGGGIKIIKEAWK